MWTNEEWAANSRKYHRLVLIHSMDLFFWVLESGLSKNEVLIAPLIACFLPYDDFFINLHAIEFVYMYIHIWIYTHSLYVCVYTCVWERQRQGGGGEGEGEMEMPFHGRDTLPWMKQRLKWTLSELLQFVHHNILHSVDWNGVLEFWSVGILGYIMIFYCG